MNQFQNDTNNYVVSDITSTVLGQGSEQPISTPCCSNDVKYQPTMMADLTAKESVDMANEQKVGDHHEYE